VPRKSSNKPEHTTLPTDNIFEDIGFPREEATRLLFKAQILIAVEEEIRRRKLTQRQLTHILDEHQPVISNLLRGRGINMSIEKLLNYGDRLGLKFEVRQIHPRPRPRKRVA
jgi:predicted XRE-type DNA-binding protein